MSASGFRANPPSETVSILVPTWRRDHFLGEALESLQRQTFRDWRAIVVDNGGGPATRGAVAARNDPRILYVKAPRNLGECGGRNLALRHARGAFVCYLDDDDVLPPDSLAERLRLLREHPGCGMVYGEYRRQHWTDGGWTDQPERPGPPRGNEKRYYDGLLGRAGYDPSVAFYLLKQLNFIRGGTPLIPRAVIDAVGPFDDRLDAYGDYEMWLRIASRYPVRFVNRVVYVYRIHPGCVHLRTARDGRGRQAALSICQRYGIRDSIEFSGFREDLNRHWAAVDAAQLVLPLAAESEQGELCHGHRR